jgi:hypothetical protein
VIALRGALIQSDSMDLVTFVSCNAIRRFHFALVGVLYDGRRFGVSGILCRVVRLEMELVKWD